MKGRILFLSMLLLFQGAFGIVLKGKGSHNASCSTYDECRGNSVEQFVNAPTASARFITASGAYVNLDTIAKVSVDAYTDWEVSNEPYYNVVFYGIGASGLYPVYTAYSISGKGAEQIRQLLSSAGFVPVGREYINLKLVDTVTINPYYDWNFGQGCVIRFYAGQGAYNLGWSDPNIFYNRVMLGELYFTSCADATRWANENLVRVSVQ